MYLSHERMAGRRNMINLPGRLGSLLGSGRRRAQRWQRVVQHPQATIFSAVADVGAYSQFLPWCLSSQVSSHSTGDNGTSTMNAEIVVGYGPLSSSFQSVVELTPHRRVHAVSSPNEHIEELSFTWDFAPLGDSACRLDLMLDFCLRKEEHVLMWELAQDAISALGSHAIAEQPLKA